jgi:hypothetical protein
MDWCICGAVRGFLEALSEYFQAANPVSSALIRNLMRLKSIVFLPILAV